MATEKLANVLFGHTSLTNDQESLLLSNRSTYVIKHAQLLGTHHLNQYSPWWNAKLFAILVMMMFCSSVQSQVMDINVTVAKDGSGDFSTIQAAINHAPSFSTLRYTIQIGEGLYEEYVLVPKNKTNLTLVGAGMDTTIISGNRTRVIGPIPHTYQTATVAIEGQGFVGLHITFANTAGKQYPQAVALRVDGNYSAFYKCRFQGNEDTLFTRRGYQFYRECEIYGTVDFIFGDSTVVLQNCFIYPLQPLEHKQNTITAHKREQPEEQTGIVIHNCTITAAQGRLLQDFKFTTFLGRPWGIMSRTIIMQSFLDDLINPEGWKEWETRPHSGDKADYAEYANRGPGANTTGRVHWSRVINSSSEATKYTVKNFIKGDRWIPAKIPYFPGLM